MTKLTLGYYLFFTVINKGNYITSTLVKLLQLIYFERKDGQYITLMVT